MKPKELNDLIDSIVTEEIKFEDIIESKIKISFN